jgi:hypothetical protein
MYELKLVVRGAVARLLLISCASRLACQSGVQPFLASVLMKTTQLACLEVGTVEFCK